MNPDQPEQTSVTSSDTEEVPLSDEVSSPDDVAQETPADTDDSKPVKDDEDEDSDSSLSDFSSDSDLSKSDDEELSCSSDSDLSEDLSDSDSDTDIDENYIPDESPDADPEPKFFAIKTREGDIIKVNKKYAEWSKTLSGLLQDGLQEVCDDDSEPIEMNDVTTRALNYILEFFEWKRLNKNIITTLIPKFEDRDDFKAMKEDLDFKEEVKLAAQTLEM